MEVPKGTPPKMLDIVITSKHLKVAVKGQPPILDADFTNDVVASESSWSLEGRQFLSLNIQKGTNRQWWKSPCVGYEEVDVTKIEPETSKLSDLDPEAQALVNKMWFDQEQKRKGLPTSDEIQKQQVMKKFMEQHPEMDFSNCKFGWWISFVSLIIINSVTLFWIIFFSFHLYIRFFRSESFAGTIFNFSSSVV